MAQDAARKMLWLLVTSLLREPFLREPCTVTRFSLRPTTWRVHHRLLLPIARWRFHGTAVELGILLKRVAAGGRAKIERLTPVLRLPLLLRRLRVDVRAADRILEEHHCRRAPFSRFSATGLSLIMEAAHRLRHLPFGGFASANLPFGRCIRAQVISE